MKGHSHLDSALEQRERYLTEISQRLQSRLTPFEIEEQLAELREHLDAMALAYEELGLGREAAMSAAVRRFGKPKQIGRDIANGIKKDWKQLLIGETLDPRTSQTSFISFMQLIAMQSVLGFVLARLSFPDFPSALALGVYGACLVSTMCWSTHKHRAVIAIGLVVTASLFSIVTTYLAGNAAGAGFGMEAKFAYRIVFDVLVLSVTGVTLTKRLQMRVLKVGIQ